ncbi:MAG: hypothetical protein M5R40_24215 [Anaerolineae bacterium]|nr:hypothetical protein [Anaerolineae bacterium]
MPSKIGVHIKGPHRVGYGEYLASACKDGTPVPLVKSVDDEGAFIDVRKALEDAEDVAYPDNASGRTVTIFRSCKEPDWDTPANNFRGNPELVAREWMGRQVQHWEGVQADYFEVMNEPDPEFTLGEEQSYQWLNRCVLECMRFADERGLKVCIYNFSAGVPEPHEFEVLLPSLYYARNHGHVLGLHEYSTEGGLRNGEGRGTVLRFRMYYNDILIPRGLGDLPLFITEAGPNGGHSWDRDLGADGFLDDVRWYDSHLRQYPLRDRGGTVHARSCRERRARRRELPGSTTASSPIEHRGAKRS